MAGREQEQQPEGIVLITTGGTVVVHGVTSRNIIHLLSLLLAVATRLADLYQGGQQQDDNMESTDDRHQQRKQ